MVLFSNYFGEGYKIDHKWRFCLKLGCMRTCTQVDDLFRFEFFAKVRKQRAEVSEGQTGGWRCELWSWTGEL